jgi:putative oxidoreductase
MVRSLPAPVRDAALLVARLVLGAVLVAHGWQKVAIAGIGATAEGFARMGVPLAPLAALFASVVELVGGALLLVGAATALVGLLVVLNMIGAAVLVHIRNGIFVTEGGWELVGVIAAAALALAAVGAGRYSVDHAIGARRRLVAV